MAAFSVEGGGAVFRVARMVSSLEPGLSPLSEVPQVLQIRLAGGFSVLQVGQIIFAIRLLLFMVDSLIVNKLSL